MKKIIKIGLFITVLLVFSINNSLAADESVLFTSVAPDALILLDLSGSMDWNPAGDSRIYGVSSCSPDTSACSGSGCSGGYCSSAKTGCNTDCSRLAIAKRAIFNMLDDTNDGVIRSSGTSTDDSSLNIRMGYMRFYNCSSNDTGGNYNSGCIQLINGINTKYSQIYCASSTQCTGPTGSGGIRGSSASGGTPLASALNEAKLYLNDHKATDSAKDCRDKFVIFVTDGADTFACSGNGSEDQNDMYRRRRETVAKAKALADAGYKVFVIGFGADMPTCLQRTLNWAAYYGGTDNPLQANSGDTGGYNIPAGSLYPSGVSSCSTTSTTVSFNICGKGGGSGDNIATSNDPATAPLEGYAFIATNADELTTALKQAVNIIRQATYSFTVTSISTARITSENNIYEASFTPIDDEPFWQGHLKKYTINTDGSLGNVVWDAGSVLANMSADSRNIKTYKNGTLTAFNTANIAPQDLALASTNTTRRDEIVGYIRGEAAYNEDNWKLGDIWHSNPIVITSPSPYFNDQRDANNAFGTFRSNNQRTSENGKRIVLAGANDGQFHVFRTSDGAEIFSFIPPNMLPKLGLIAHNSHPTTLQHQYFVDGPVSSADVWLGSGDGTSKSASDWRTLVIFSEGRGAGSYLWSESSNCTPTSSTSPYGYSLTYNSTTSYYCGYYAFDFTDTLNPVYKWRINPTASDAPYFGEPWSKMTLGKVKISGNEKWVGFVGGGGFSYDCSTGGNCAAGSPDPPTTNFGKGFFVIDLSNGNILWSYTKATNSAMDFSIPASPAIVDTDNDGFIDTAYIGDLGGNMWRFKFCTHSQGSSCNTSDWSGGMFYNASSSQIRPIYTGAVISKDDANNLWVYWGTGDKQCPACSSAQEHFYALKDNDRSTTYTLSDIENLTSEDQTYSGTKNGWRIQFAGSGEKMLAEPTVFGGVVYFTTYTPGSGSNPCQQSGTGKLYAVNYKTGAGAISGQRSTTLGAGIPSSPVVSLRPDGSSADIYVTVSGGAGTDARTIRPPGITLNLPTSRSNILYWKDRRVQ